MSKDITEQYSELYPHPFRESFIEGAKNFLGEFSQISKNNISRSYQLKENNGYYLASLDIPGVEAKDIEVSVDYNILHVEAKRDDEVCDYRYESTFLLPENVSEDSVRAIYQNGVLKVAIAKNKETSQKIPLKRQSSKNFFQRLFAGNGFEDIFVKRKKKKFHH